MNPKEMMTNAAAIHSVTEVLSCHFLGFFPGGCWVGTGPRACSGPPHGAAPAAVCTVGPETCRLFSFRLIQAIFIFDSVRALRPAGIPSTSLGTGLPAVRNKGKMPSPRRFQITNIQPGTPCCGISKIAHSSGYRLFPAGARSQQAILRLYNELKKSLPLSSDSWMLDTMKGEYQ